LLKSQAIQREARNDAPLAAPRAACPQAFPQKRWIVGVASAKSVAPLHRGMNAAGIDTQQDGLQARP
jgi:hypothetical protein